jgi:hypothetical protein
VETAVYHGLSPPPPPVEGHIYMYSYDRVWRGVGSSTWDEEEEEEETICR